MPFALPQDITLILDSLDYIYNHIQNSTIVIMTYRYYYYISLQVAKRLKTGSVNAKLNDFNKKLTAKCNELGYSMGESKNHKTRNKKVVARCFNKIGIVVPVDANDVGYRPLPMTNGMNNTSIQP